MLIFLTDIKTMEEYTFLAPLLLTIGGLIIGAILKSLLKHSRLPYTVGLHWNHFRSHEPYGRLSIAAGTA